MFNFIEKQWIIQNFFLSIILRYTIILHNIQLINGWMKTRMYLQYSRYLHVKKFNKQFFMILILVDYDYLWRLMIVIQHYKKMFTWLEVLYEQQDNLKRIKYYKKIWNSKTFLYIFSVRSESSLNLKEVFLYTIAF